MPIVSDIQIILRNARQNTLRSINKEMLTAYWLIGRRIIEEEQNGDARAAYGKSLLKQLSTELKSEFGKGFSVDNLQNMRLFYLTYPSNGLHQPIIEAKNNYETLSRNLQIPDFQLSWSHYLLMISITDKNERSFYEIESAKNNWSIRELKRQYDSALYLRLALSTDKEGISKLAQKGTSTEKQTDLIKDPYILEFLDLPEQARYSESDLEHALINKLEHFLLELGTGFTFSGRQKRLTIDEEHYFVDLVFYNRLLRCFVLIDLKIGKLKHQDIGQMQMYVNYHDRYVKTEDENKTIGIILCRNKSETLVEITLPEDNNQIFASRYQTILPDKETLRKILIEKTDEQQ